MSDLFRRAWRVQVGSLDVSDLAVKFKVTRSLYARAGTADVTIYNLSEEHRREITHAPRRTTFVEVQAGYEEGRSVIFRGDLRKAIPAREGPTWSVRVTAGDGEHALKVARVARSFSSSATVQQVVQHLADAMGVGIGNAASALRAARLDRLSDLFPEGSVLRGSAAGELTRLVDSAGLSWSVQDGNLLILPRGGALAREAILLSAETGMVESPEVVNRRTINVKTLILPGLVPGQQVVVESGVIARSTWRISEVEYSGDTQGSDWFAALTLHRPLPPLITPAP